MMWLGKKVITGLHIGVDVRFWVNVLDGCLEATYLTYVGQIGH